MKRNIYFAQISDVFGKNIYLPYSAGVIAAFSFENEDIKKSYVLKEIIFERESINKIIGRLESPFLVAFSTYLWNFEYSKELARKIKNVFPECIIVFGGHNVNNNSSNLLKECDFIDILVHEEGEVAFNELLLHLINEDNKYFLEKISNISFRNHHGQIIKTHNVKNDITHFPSAYLNGIFDNIIKTGKTQYSCTLETNRGCPFRCSYCDYGTIDGKGVRLFPLERIYAEIEWFGMNKIEFVFCADANFGLLKRDMNIVDHLINVHKKYSFPKIFRVCYSKNNVDAVYEINKKLNNYGLNRGGTVSFQSLNEEALKNIGRKNIPLSQFHELMELYKKDQTPVYTELIIGLPGETYESFCNSVENLIKNGQHSGIFFYNCEVLPNSLMGQDEYIKKYEIETIKTPAARLHSKQITSDIIEYSYYIVKTYSMSREDWISINIFSNVIQAFHALGLLQKIAIYLFHNSDLSYNQFYNKLIDYSKKLPSSSLLNSVYTQIYETIVGVLYNGKPMEYRNEKFGLVSWSLDEGLFLYCVDRYNEFYAEIIKFLKETNLYTDIIKELIEYQKCIIKMPFTDSYSVVFNYDFNKFFNTDYTHLDKKENKIIINYSERYNDIKEYAKKIIWYGRKSWKMVNKDFIVEYK